MAKNLFDFGSESIEDKYINNDGNYKNENSSNSKGSNNKSKEELTKEASTLYEKYKDYSQNDLINEFLSTSKQKLNDGSLTKEKINSTANALLPFLNESQKEMMSNILDRLND